MLCLSGFELYSRWAPLKLIGTKLLYNLQKSSTPTGLVWNTYMAAVSMFWNTNMVTETSCENNIERAYGNGRIYSYMYIP